MRCRPAGGLGLAAVRLLCGVLLTLRLLHKEIERVARAHPGRRMLLDPRHFNARCNQVKKQFLVRWRTMVVKTTGGRATAEGGARAEGGVKEERGRKKGNPIWNLNAGIADRRN